MITRASPPGRPLRRTSTDCWWDRCLGAAEVLALEDGKGGSASRGRLHEEALEGLVDHVPQGLLALPGYVLGPLEQLVVDVHRRAHGDDPSITMRASRASPAIPPRHEAHEQREASPWR